MLLTLRGHTYIIQSMVHTRASIESAPFHERPRVRCRVGVAYTPEDGPPVPGIEDVSGSIVIDGNNPWIVSSRGIEQLEFRVTWELLLELLNDKSLTPLYLNQDRPVTLETI